MVKKQWRNKLFTTAKDSLKTINILTDQKAKSLSEVDWLVIVRKQKRSEKSKYSGTGWLTIQTPRGHAVVSVLSRLSGKTVTDACFIDLKTNAGVFTRQRCLIS